MKPIEVKFKDIKKVLGSIEIIIGPEETDVSQLYDPPLPEPDYQTIDGLLEITSNSSIFHLRDKFRYVRDEISSNLTMPIEIGSIREYLNKIFTFYSDLESRIIEDDQGKLSCDFVKLIEITYNELTEYLKDYYDGFIVSFRSSLRTEIGYIFNIIKTLEEKDEISSTKKNSSKKENIIWKRDKGDLIELIKALCLSGAINNSTNNLTETEAYRIFGELLNVVQKPDILTTFGRSKLTTSELVL
jgi:hypothetical protein